MFAVARAFRGSRGRCDQRGTALIELALILPFLLVISLTVVDLSRAFYVKGMLTSAAREGARIAVLRGAPAMAGSADNDSVKARVNEALAPVIANSAYGLSSVTVNVTSMYPYYRITVTGSFSWLYLGLLEYLGDAGFTNPQALTATVTMRRLVG